MSENKQEARRMNVGDLVTVVALHVIVWAICMLTLVTLTH